MGKGHSCPVTRPPMILAVWEYLKHLISFGAFFVVGVLGLWLARRVGPDPQRPRWFYWVLAVVGGAGLIIVALAAVLGWK